MGNMCCRRVAYSPSGAEMDQSRCHQQTQQQQQKSQTMSNAFHNAGDDCAINELLEGRMDLDVVLPDGRQVRLTVERRTPMMDLLVQAASATKISPGGHVIHVFGDGGKGSGTLQYKPSTPIGSLDTNTICIVPKNSVQDSSGKKAPKFANRPFEPTFRVQVHLPRNQLTVARVSPRVKISELRTMVCKEKGLDTAKYQLVRPSNPALPLTGDMTLAEYGSTEITLLSNSCIESHICNSTSQFIPYPKRNEEQKKKTGILRLLAEDRNHKVGKVMNNNIVDSSRRTAPGTKPDDLHPHQGRYKPKKRRPAPPPPPPALPETPSHSRQSSSDSSGYHEATSSFFHEEHSLAAMAEKASSDSSGVSSLDAKVQAVPTTAVQNAKKRKAPPPPPPPLTEKNLVVRKEPDPVMSSELDTGGRPVQSRLVVDVADAERERVHVLEGADKDQETVTITEKHHGVQSEIPLNSLEPCSRSKEAKSEKDVNGGEAVTRVALVALSARIEQDVTQQEIASNIQAAFHSLDCHQRIEPSQQAIKQKNTSSGEKDTAVERANFVETHVPLRSPTLVSDKNVLKNRVTCQIGHYTEKKPTVRLSLNLERKENGDRGIQASLARSELSPKISDSVKEALVIDQDSSRSSPTTVQSEISKSLKRSSSLLSIADVAQKNSLKKNAKQVRHLQRSLSNLSVDDKEEFEAEQERLQKEYVKLQRQFILWQQQLLNNHAMLREECIVPQYARTLRQSHSLPEGEDYSDESQTCPPLVSRSLSYEPTKERCSTLPRSAINIPSLEIGSIPANNGSHTLRSSKTKSYFKPPQVRVSTKSRQRLPPEIRKEGELDISDDTKILATILPSFESLKLITESYDVDVHSNPIRLKNGTSTSKVENSRNVFVDKANNTPKELPATLPKPNSRLNNGDCNLNDSNLKCANGDTGQSKVVHVSAKMTEKSEPPPPPPMPMIKKVNGTIAENSLKSTASIRNGVEKKSLIPQTDPREQLMQEIRRFGGRTALRKISLAPSS